MKNTILFTVSLFIAISSFSQKIEQINYGESFNALKQMKYYDLKDEFSTTGQKERLIASLSRTMYAEKFAFSSFIPKFSKTNKGLGNLTNKYVEEVENELMKKSLANSFFSNKVDKSSYEYLQLVLKKFEAITEYYVGLHNYLIDKRIMQKEMEANKGIVNDSIKIIKQEIQDLISNDKELNQLLSSKSNEIKEIENKYNKKESSLNLKKKAEIKSLPLENYSSNKGKIIEKYDPEFKSVKLEKEREIDILKVKWNRKINERKNILNINLNKEIENTNSSSEEVVKKSNNNIKEKYKLAEKREKLENDYESSVSIINENIETLMKKRKNLSGVKNSARKLFKF